MSLSVFELREIDDLLRDFDHMLWKADSRTATQFRIRIQVLLKRLEEIMKEKVDAQITEAARRA
jgi:hypothetical protein